MSLSTKMQNALVFMFLDTQMNVQITRVKDALQNVFKNTEGMISIVINCDVRMLTRLIFLEQWKSKVFKHSVYPLHNVNEDFLHF